MSLSKLYPHTPRQAPAVIAEIGCNHQGSLDKAMEMIRVASEYCHADYVKFQTRDIDTWIERKPDLYNGPHPVPHNSYGHTYADHRRALEFGLSEHLQLAAYADEVDIQILTSVWDVKSAELMAEVYPNDLKVPSACNLDFDLMKWLATSYEGTIHVSLGMTTWEEEASIVDWLDKWGALQDTVLYHCVSDYPVLARNANLGEIVRLRAAYGSEVRGIGYSGHHNGIALDMIAMAYGADYVERHFTLDRTMKGTDHAASLEPDGLRKLVRDLKAGEDATRVQADLQPCEWAGRNKMKWVSHGSD